MTPRETIDKAVKATDAILEQWQRAEEVLQRFMVNGTGVHSDPTGLKIDLKIVAERIALAQAIAHETDWPTAADYADAEG
jgi:hypothetical protein